MLEKEQLAMVPLVAYRMLPDDDYATGRLDAAVMLMVRDAAKANVLPHIRSLLEQVLFSSQLEVHHNPDDGFGL